MNKPVLQSDSDRAMNLGAELIPRPPHTKVRLERAPERLFIEIPSPGLVTTVWGMLLGGLGAGVFLLLLNFRIFTKGHLSWDIETVVYSAALCLVMIWCAYNGYKLAFSKTTIIVSQKLFFIQDGITPFLRHKRYSIHAFQGLFLSYDDLTDELEVALLELTLGTDVWKIGESLSERELNWIRRHINAFIEQN